jgi:hypothetical protein
MEISLNFPLGGSEASGCYVNLNVRKISGHIKLCITDYADSICDSGVYFTKDGN